MRPRELRELIESRREYSTSESASERISEIQRDLHPLEGHYEDEIRDLLNASDYEAMSVSFNISIETPNVVVTSEEWGIRYMRLLR